MNVILLEQNNSAFISNTETDRNFYSLDYITISDYISKKAETKCTALMNFNINLLKNRSIEVENAKLILPIEIFKTNNYSSDKEIRISYNTDSFSYKTVTWNTKPKSHFYTSMPISQESISQKYLLIEMTNLLKDWLNNTIKNLGISVYFNTPNIMMVLPKNKVKYSPKLIVKYTYNCHDPDVDTNPAAIFIEGNNLDSIIIKPQKIIKFNKVTTVTPHGISYNSDTGVITITRRGYYTCHCELSLDGSDGGLEDKQNYLNIALKNLSTGITINFYMPEVLQGKLLGNALISVTEKKEDYVLINNSLKSLQVSNIPIQGSLLISSI